MLPKDLKEWEVDVVYEYGYYNDLKKDREYYTKLYKNRGYENVHVKKVKTDTVKLNMYEITLW